MLPIGSHQFAIQDASRHSRKYDCTSRYFKRLRTCFSFFCSSADSSMRYDFIGQQGARRVANAFLWVDAYTSRSYPFHSAPLVAFGETSIRDILSTWNWFAWLDFQSTHATRYPLMTLYHYLSSNATQFRAAAGMQYRLRWKADNDFQWSSFEIQWINNWGPYWWILDGVSQAPVSPGGRLLEILLNIF